MSALFILEPQIISVIDAEVTTFYWAKNGEELGSKIYKVWGNNIKTSTLLFSIICIFLFAHDNLKKSQTFEPVKNDELLND